MAYDPGMTQPKRKQPATPEIETDLLRIAFTRARGRKLGIPVLAQTERPDNIYGIGKR